MTQKHSMWAECLQGNEHEEKEMSCSVLGGHGILNKF